VVPASCSFAPIKRLLALEAASAFPIPPSTLTELSGNLVRGESAEAKREVDYVRIATTHREPSWEPIIRTGMKGSSADRLIRDAGN
jgi:hypothetical protein